jgi:hypothetical protein
MSSLLRSSARLPKQCGRLAQHDHTGQTQETNEDHRSANERSTDRTERHGLLAQQYEYGDRGDLQQVHHAADEQQAHQNAAAVKTVGPESQSHAKGTRERADATPASAGPAGSPTWTLIATRQRSTCAHPPTGRTGPSWPSTSRG